MLIFKFDSREHLCPKTSRAFLESEKATWRTEGLRPAKMAVILNKKLDPPDPDPVSTIVLRNVRVLRRFSSEIDGVYAFRLIKMVLKTGVVCVSVLCWASKVM